MHFQVTSTTNCTHNEENNLVTSIEISLQYSFHCCTMFKNVDIHILVSKKSPKFQDLEIYY